MRKVMKVSKYKIAGIYTKFQSRQILLSKIISHLLGVIIDFIPLLKCSLYNNIYNKPSCVATVNETIMTPVISLHVNDKPHVNKHNI
jgi:hypothetical protein